MAMAMDQSQDLKKNMERVRYKVAVMSGKGGVGKTTVAVNLAIQLAAKGMKVGLLDADIDCPNVAKFLNLEKTFEVEGKTLKPIEDRGMRISSMAFFGQPYDQPSIFRGPIIHKALMQLLETTDWGLLDFLIIDMPPGTSDAVLTIMQFLGPDGIVIVTTPQELAVQDARRAANLARQFGKGFGVVGNMAGDVFGKDTKKIAEEMGASFLGELPLDKQIAEKKVIADEKNVKELEKIIENLKNNVLG